METDFTTISELIIRLKALNSSLESTVEADYMETITRALKEIASVGLSTGEEEGNFNYEASQFAAKFHTMGENCILSAMHSAWESLSSDTQDALRGIFDRVDTELHMDHFVAAARRHVSSLEHSLNVDFEVLDNRIIELLDQLRNLLAIFRTSS